MRIILSWFLVFGFIHIGHGQTATILSKEGKVPLESVLLHSINPNIQGITNKNGQVDLSPFMSVEKIDIRYLGYKPIIESYLSIKEKGFIIYLEEAGITLDEMVISASRWQESSKGIPSKIRTISTSNQLMNLNNAALTQAGNNAAQNAEVLVKHDKESEDWINKKWRPAMGWMYMAVCVTDFILFPIAWSILQATTQGSVTTPWQPISLQGAGLFHIAMGAVLGIAVYGRTKEKLENASTADTTVGAAPANPVSAFLGK